MKRIFRVLILTLSGAVIYSCSGEKEPETTDTTEQESEVVEGEEETPEEIIEEEPAELPEFTKEEIATAIGNVKSVRNNVPYYVITTKGLFFYTRQGSGKDAKYGLCDKTGEELLPAEYDKIYNPESIILGHAIAEKNGKRGVYDLSGKWVIEPELDGIYPRLDKSALASVRVGSKYGFLGKDGKVNLDKGTSSNEDYFVSPFENKSVEKWEIDIQKSNLLYATESTVEEGGGPEYGAATYFIPPHIADLGLTESDRIEEIIVGKQNADFGIEETKIEIQQAKKTGESSSLFAKFYDSGIDARGWVTKKKQLVTVDNNLKKINRVDFLGTNYQTICTIQSHKLAGDDLLEVKNSIEGGLSGFSSFTNYRYYKIKTGGEIELMKTNRFFPCTKMVKMDESYFKGCFSRVAREDEITESNEESYGMTHITYQHMTIEMLDIMRNEIFASHGYKFNSEKWQKYFGAKGWYEPAFDNVDDKLSEIEKYNIKVILKVKEKMNGREEEFTKPGKTNWVAAG